MKTKKLLFLFSLIAIAFSSCQDGDLGVSTFKVLNNSGFASNFWTSDPNVPTAGSFGVDYTTKAGTYSYTYDYGIYNYSGYYTITQDKGDTWNGFTNGFLIKAPDGPKRHYSFDCDLASGDELSWTRSHINSTHTDIIIDQTIYFNGGKMIIKGKGVYNSKNQIVNSPAYSTFNNK